MLRLRGTVQAAASPERTDESPVTNKQRRRGETPPIFGETQVPLPLWLAPSRLNCNCALFWPLVRALVICNCHGEVKRDAFVTSPIPLCVSFRFVCCVRAPACVHACPFSCASKWQPRATRDRDWSPAVRAPFNPFAAKATHCISAVDPRGHFRMFYYRDESAIVIRSVHG